MSPLFSMPRSDRVLDFAPDIVRIERRGPAPLPRAVLYVVVALLAVTGAWMYLGKLDVVAVTQGRLVPQSFVKIVQPAEAGIVRAILVKEGQLVREGQVLVRMDTRVSDADVRTLEVDLQRRDLQLRRIDAELSATSLKRTRADPPDVFAQIEAQLKARRQAHLDAVGAEEAVRARAEHDLGAALEVEAKLKQTAPIYQEQASAWDKLAREGFAGRLLALDRQRTYIEAEQELRAQARNIEGLKATIAQAEKRIAQIQSNYRQQLYNERVEAEAHFKKVQQDWDKQQHRHGLLELRAPQAGIVKDLATHTPGAVVAPGTILLTLVPHDEPLLAEVWVTNADAGFVQPEQRARLKFAAYPFQKYGLLDGVVQQVSADAQDRARDAGSAASAKPNADAAYRALIRLDAEHLQAGTQRLRLVPGMLVSAEVHIGRRSVLEYLLSPVQKVVYEAGRER